MNVIQKSESAYLCADVKGYSRPTNLTVDHLPILDAKVGPLSVNAARQKAYWLLAEIHPHHLGNGENTSINRSLSQEIRSRGKHDDDCGHIIASSLGGKMVDFNLFPQNKSINRGWKGWSKHWRKSIEVFIFLWLKNRSFINPRVEFQVRLFYNDHNHPDRPDCGKLSITFKFDHGKSTKDGDDHDGKETPMPSYATLKGNLMNFIENELDSVPEPNYTTINWEQLSKFNSLNTIQFQEFIWLFLHDLKTKVSMQDLKPTSAQNQTIQWRS
ncbi:unnamed protein product [Rotaria sp. Silwood1]|nr:unnamed protein product [Rotaria sp. Silwood1]CAF3666882.1 unnamed protein product [Rotaria sp. Silwood1]CAF4610298.1 unnamed protein product [Rotaria sp. Silwood1]